METISVISGRASVEKSVIISLAGNAAERRARRKDSKGFALWIRSADHLRALHESGHAVAAIALGHHVYSATIAEDQAVKVGHGHSGGTVWCGSSPEAPPVADQKPERVPSDGEEISRQCLLLSTDLSWRGALRTMRDLRELSRLIVDRNWIAIVAFSELLMKCKTLNQEQVEKLLRHCA